MKRIVIDVYGRVQGVFFRYNTKKTAKSLGLYGYVRNMSDGSVHIEAEGPEEKLEELLKFAREGPIHARVDRVEYEYKEAKGELKDFKYEF
jgi:acylphosphatase